ncbi:hypothetical protein BC833DRAFT_65887 [Globomyces pollinis-pini]|nr:hypothetical protein BC833DRAFT_65887 [Globomyces pollinis-pini]
MKLAYLKLDPNGGKPDSIRAHNTKPRSATITGDRREILELHSAKSVSSNEPKTDHVMNAYIKPSPGSTPPTSVFSSSLSVRRSSEQTNTAEHLELKRDDLISRVSGSKVRLNNSTTIRVTNESDEHVNGSPIQHRISRHNSRKSILETGEPMTSTGTKPSIVRMSSTKSNLKNLAVEDKDTHGEDFGILQTHSRRNSSKKPGIDGYEHHDQPLSRKHTEIHLNKKESDSDPNSEHMNGSPIQHRISRHNSKKSILETNEAMSSKPSPIVKVSSTKSNLKNLAVGDKEAHGEHIVTEKDFGNLQTHSRRNSSKKPGNEGNEHHDQPISRKHTETHSTKKENIVAKEHINTSHKDDKRSYPIEKQSESKVPLEKHESFLPKLIPNTTNSLTVNANPNHPLPKLLPNEHFIESCESLSLEDLSRPMFNRTTIKRK